MGQNGFQSGNPKIDSSDSILICSLDLNFNGVELNRTGSNRFSHQWLKAFNFRLQCMQDNENHSLSLANYWRFSLLKKNWLANNMQKVEMQTLINTA